MRFAANGAPVTALSKTSAQLAVHDPDTRLMLGVRDDEPGAFEELVQRYQHRLVGILHHLFAREGVDSQEVYFGFEPVNLLFKFLFTSIEGFEERAESVTLDLSFEVELIRPFNLNIKKWPKIRGADSCFLGKFPRLSEDFRSLRKCQSFT